MLRSYYLILAAMVLAACSNDGPKTVPAAPAAAAKPAIMAPFHFHKMIEVSPGQDYDVLSWGRAGGNTGSFLILHSDSAKKQYTTTTGDLEGNITDVYNSDMDADGDPELIIQAREKDTINYSTIYAFEFNDNKANKLDFPKLTSTQKKGYRGGDNFYMKDGKLIREFPLYDGNSATAKSTGQKRVLQYNLHSNELTVKDLSKDTLKNLNTPVAPATPVKQPEKPKADNKKETGKSSSSSSQNKSSKKKHRSTESSSGHKKKKHRRS